MTNQPSPTPERITEQHREAAREIHEDVAKRLGLVHVDCGPKIEALAAILARHFPAPSTGRMHEKSPCPCLIVGKDGTHNHNEIVATYHQSSTGTTFQSCANHLDGYVDGFDGWKRTMLDSSPAPSRGEPKCPHCNSPARQIEWCEAYRLPHICPTDHISHQRPDLFCDKCGGLLIDINESEDEDSAPIICCSHEHAHREALRKYEGVRPAQNSGEGSRAIPSKDAEARTAPIGSSSPEQQWCAQCKAVITDRDLAAGKCLSCGLPCTADSKPSEERTREKCYHVNTMGHESESWCVDCGERWPNTLHRQSTPVTLHNAPSPTLQKCPTCGSPDRDTRLCTDKHWDVHTPAHVPCHLGCVECDNSEFHGAIGEKHDCKTDDRKLPIDRPCSACSAGDPEMKYHNHCPPFKASAVGKK